MVRKSTLALAAALGLSLGVLPAAAEWRAGFQRGNEWASVRNDADSKVQMFCSSGTDRPQASIWYEPAGGAASQPAGIVFAIDGEEHPVEGHWQEGSFVFHLYSPQRFAEGDALIEALRKGRRLEVRLAGSDSGEAFTLTGSADALDGIFDNCRGRGA